MMQYRSLIAVFILMLGLIGCSQQTGSSLNNGVKQSKAAVAARQPRQVGRVGSFLLSSSRLVALNTQPDGANNILVKFIPAVKDGIDYALQQGSSAATQNIKRDGALTIDEKTGQLTLLIFLKSNSMITLGGGPNYIKGDRDAGFLWSCIQDKLQASLKADSELNTSQINALIQDFNITYINTSGQRLSITMPEDTPLIKLDGEELSKDDDVLHAKMTRFFEAQF